jgi:hypothetical protein
MSPLTSSPRLSVNPPNAMLNYLYAVLESEARLAAAALGLDPGLGLMHMDAPARDNLACDLMEPVRPLVDEYVLNWLLHQPLKREWFFEERNGTCRLMGSFVQQLSTTAPTWAQMIGPIAERIAQALWATVPTSVRRAGSGTPLTQRRRREANGVELARIPLPPRPPRLCQLCGAPLTDGVHCALCVASLRRDSIRRKQGREKSARNRSDHESWLTREVFIDRIQPRLREKTTAEVACLLGVSKWYAMDIRLGRCCPHPRHFQALATLAGVAANGSERAP